MYAGIYPVGLRFVQESSDDSDEGNTTDAQPDVQESHDDNQAASDGAQKDISDQISIFNHLPFPEVLYSQDDNIRPSHVASSPPVGSPVFEDPPIVASSSGLSPSLLNIVSPLASASTWTSSASPLSSADICDLRSHFSTEVPRRALQVPMVLKAVLCLAARHDAIMSNSSDWEASEYHGQCLELLIAALALPEETYDDNLLITVVTLRIYEELERATDEKCHWSASSGGLAEAVSWQFLRQAIYASLVQHQPMQLDLANYELSSVFRRRDDASYANIIIFLCAKIIQSCWGSHCSFVDEGEWQHLSESVEQWHRARPISWQPLQYKDSDLAENRPFPELWMMSPPAVVGLQYYHASCILLTSSHRHWNVSSDYELARLRRTEERTIASHLVRTIGLSMSNETVENAYFMACHLLHRYGYCLRHPSEKQGSLKFLRRVEKAVGWRTDWMIRELEVQWGELAEMDRWD
ncbi:hypothetical protein M752DRAFT_308859 [Aspergillus phoenicis ATCC 13157]|uniref:Zn(II)2Cys6 transcription factor n=1 Tax=Aspergillus phoenicis ATCC 13157 TaxID=1353007 RepID=A0A370P6K9_ASPPH|nr:hypothetical protein M752DRAFT_308859 [Aspergillus phoenicis ATCC 13157]